MRYSGHFFLKRVIAAGLLASAICGSGCSALLPQEEDKLPPPLVSPQTIQYRTEPAERKTLIQQISFGGEFQSEKRYSIAFEQGGRIKAIHVSQGDKVQKGDLIAELETGTLEYQISLQNLELEKAQLRMNDLRTKGADATAQAIAKLDYDGQMLRLQELERQRNACRLTAPIDGDLVYLTSTPIGEQVRAFDMIARIADTSKLLLISTNDRAASIPVGQEVSVVYRKNSYTATAASLPGSLATEKDSQLAKARMFFRFQDGIPEGAKLGETVQMTFIQEKREQVVVIPRIAIKMVSGRKYVHVLENNIRVERDIETGLLTDTEVEIIKGVNENDLLVVN